MSWRIVYSLQARQDLRSIFEYIFNELCAPDAAARQSKKIMHSIRDLEEMPLRYPLYEGEQWSSMGLRFFPVDNYLIFNLPNETDEIVNIVRIMYSGCDIRKQLSEIVKF